MAANIVEDGNYSSGLEKQHSHPESDADVRKPTSRIQWTIGLVARLCIWYMLLVPFLRCPSRLSELNDSSPVVCKPYIITRSHVVSHVRPYYVTYGAPYVEIARPYVQTFNHQVGTPTVRFAKQGYDRYGAPVLKQAELYGHEQWRKEALPRLQSLQGSLYGVYQKNVNPYVQRATITISPYYQRAKSHLSQAHEQYVLPLYAQSGPFIGKTYTTGQDVLTTTVLPYAGGAWSSAVHFINNSLWPTVTGLYWENVEPQLVKIGHKLASYREGGRFRPTADEDGSSPVPSTSAVSTDTSKPSATAPSTTTQVVYATQKPPLSAENTNKPRAKVSSDLEEWQNRFSVATSKGVEDLKERISDIIEDHVTSEAANNGTTLALELETSVQSELSNVKLQINSSTKSLPPIQAAEDEDRATNDVVNSIRGAAIFIRDRAQVLRKWHSSFDQDLTSRVLAAVDSTLEILDNIRDLGLQEIGTRWARTDGVTYKDWARYYAYKAQSGDWRDEVKNAAMQHEKLNEARSLSGEVFDHGMDVAENAAKELSRLKEVGKWKIAAREVSDNFDTRTEPPPAPPVSLDEHEQSPEENAPDAEESPESPPSSESSHLAAPSADSVPGDGVETEAGGMEGDELLPTEQLSTTASQHSSHPSHE